MPQSESLVSKLREDAHLDCPSKPDNPAESVVAWLLLLLLLISKNKVAIS